jgi:hypothetical protein
MLTTRPEGPGLHRHGERDRTGPDLAVVHVPLTACEARLEHGPARRAPTIAIVGASYTAGVGPDDPAKSWAVDLARLLHWNAVIIGVPGVGYAKPGTGGQGPVARLLAREGLRGLGPRVVIVQAGHDDVGVPVASERGRVIHAVNLIRTAAPRARLALLTVFTGPSLTAPPAVHLTDAAIVAAGSSADRGAIIMDPLRERWRYQHAHSDLHPTAAGDAWIAAKVAAILRAHGVGPAPVTGLAPVICDVTIGVGQHSASA